MVGDEALLEELKALKINIARKREGPPFVILRDKSRRETVDSWLTTTQEGCGDITKKGRA